MSKTKTKKKPRPEPMDGTFVPHPEAEKLLPIGHAKQDAEVAHQWAHRARQDYRLEDPAPVSEPTTVAGIIGRLTESGDLVNGSPNPEVYRPLAEEREKASKRRTRSGKPVFEADGRTLTRAGREEPERGEQPVGKPEPTAPPAPEVLLEKPADPVLENGNGQPVIHFIDPVTGKEKVKGYTRVTTYIDGLDDKTVLNKWKLRTLLEGAALELEQDTTGDGGAIAAVGRAVHRLDAALADIDRREAVESELLGLRRAELIAEHRKWLEATAENLLDIGGAHDKATKGTDLHRLTELVDAGLPLPTDTSASDRRDVEAYQAKVAELGLKVLWSERRVVLDDIQVSGTMDRAYLVKLPGTARRVRVVGDLKTGSITWGAAKIGMQLALYARGKGYDWTKPLERAELRLSKAFGLLIHLPQGEGVCEVYVVDLELAAKGLQIAKEVREWRNAGKRVFDIKKPLRAPEPIALNQSDT